MSWQQVVEKTVTGLGLDLVELERSAGGMLRVFIDRLEAEEFVTVDDCERVTRQLQYLLEVENVDYSRLEVSSPGLDRPLKTPAHFMRFLGQDIDVTLRVALQNRKKFRGRLVNGDSETSWGLVFGEPGQEQVLNFTLDEIREARLVPVLDFKGRKASKPAAATEDKKPDGDSDPMNRELLLLVDAISREKSVEREVVFGAVESALAQATKKFVGTEWDVRVSIDRESGEYETFRRWLVVPDSAGLQNPDAEEILSDAVDRVGAIEEGDYIEEGIDSVPIGRIVCPGGQAGHLAKDPRR